jgi:predicted DNA-binding transcriptional regulator AlpA
MPKSAPTLELPPTGFLRASQIIGNRKKGIPALIPICKSSWFAGVKQGKFPKGVLLGPHTRAWTVESIRAVMAEMSNQQGAQ